MTDNYQNKTQAELIEIILDLENKIKISKSYVKNYHKSEKGKVVRAKANTKYLEKMKAHPVYFNCTCGKTIKNHNKNLHFKSNYHKKRVPLFNQSNPVAQ